MTQPMPVASKVLVHGEHTGFCSQPFLLGQSPSEAVLGLVSLALATIWAARVCKHSGWLRRLGRPGLGTGDSKSLLITRL